MNALHLVFTKALEASESPVDSIVTASCSPESHLATFHHTKYALRDVCSEKSKFNAKHLLQRGLNHKGVQQINYWNNLNHEGTVFVTRIGVQLDKTQCV